MNQPTFFLLFLSLPSLAHSTNIYGARHWADYPCRIQWATLWADNGWEQRQDLVLHFVSQALPEDAQHPTSGGNKGASIKVSYPFFGNNGDGENIQNLKFNKNNLPEDGHLLICLTAPEAIFRLFYFRTEWVHTFPPPLNPALAFRVKCSLLLLSWNFSVSPLLVPRLVNRGHVCMTLQ